MKKLILSTLIVVLFSLDAFSAFTTDEDRESLAGLEGVYVVVEDVNESYGITRQQLLTDVELRLRQNGIKVLSEEEWFRTKGGQHLYLNVLLERFDELGVYIVSISLKLKQKVVLVREPSKSVFATTWHVWNLNVFGSDKLQHLREEAKDHVDSFCNDYLAANPIKQRDKTSKNNK